MLKGREEPGSSRSTSWLFTAAEHEPSEWPQLFHGNIYLLWLYETYLNSIRCTSLRERTLLVPLDKLKIHHSTLPKKSHICCVITSVCFVLLLFRFFLATAQSGISGCCSLPCQTSEDPSAIFRLSTKQAKFHTWRAQRKLLWLQFVLRHLAGVTQADWMNELRTSEASHSCCCLHLVPLGPDFFFFFLYTYSEMRITGVHSGSTETRLIFHHIPHQMQASENLLISQLLFSAEGDGCQRQVMFAHYINLEQQIKSWSDFNYLHA